MNQMQRHANTNWEIFQIIENACNKFHQIEQEMQKN